MGKCYATELENHIGHSIETENDLHAEPEVPFQETVSVREIVILEIETEIIGHAPLHLSPATVMSQIDRPDVAHAALIDTEDRTVHATMAVRPGGEETTVVVGLEAPSGARLHGEAHAGRPTAIRRLLDATKDMTGPAPQDEISTIATCKFPNPIFFILPFPHSNRIYPPSTNTPTLLHSKPPTPIQPKHGASRPIEMAITLTCVLQTQIKVSI